MLYSRGDATRVQLALYGTGGLAWTALLAAPLKDGPDLTAAMCGSALAPASATSGLATAAHWPSIGLAWLLMVLAMMTPLLRMPILHIRISAFRDRRWRSIALFLFGYLAVWLAAGVLIKPLEWMVHHVAPGGWVPAVVAALLAVCWQVSPLKQRYLNRCHAQRALPAFGREADLHAWYFGLEHGAACLGSCWALMLFADSLPQWHISAMALVALLMVCERMDPPASPSWQPRGWRTAALRLRQIVRRHADGPHQPQPATQTPV